MAPLVRSVVMVDKDFTQASSWESHAGGLEGFFRACVENYKTFSGGFGELRRRRAPGRPARLHAWLPCALVFLGGGVGGWGMNGWMDGMLTAGPKSDRHRLKLYGTYKQATVGDCNEEKPFDKKKREKWEAWMM